MSNSFHLYYKKKNERRLTEMIGEKPNNPLEAFLLLGKNVRGIAATQLVQQVTEAANIFVFGELLQLDGIKEVGFYCSFL